MTEIAQHRAVEVWLHRLDPGGSFTPDERRSLEHALGLQRRFRAQDVLIDQWHDGEFGLLVLEGLAARCKETEGGKRQIISILVPGDFCSGGLALVLPVDYQLVALSDGRAAWISAAQIRRMQDTSPGVMLPLGRSIAEEMAIVREWVLNVGARSGEARVAHLLCELTWRLRAVGLATEGGSVLPIRQQDIADAAGLTQVHANRVLNRLQKQGFVELGHQRIEVRDRSGLAKLCHFNPEYLLARETGKDLLAWRGLSLHQSRQRKRRG